jgi:hypothetical protein
MDEHSYSALHFNCYRRFLCEYISNHDLSYRTFAKRHSSYVSFPFLSKLLRKNPTGDFVCEVNIKPEKLAALLKAMGLSSPEISHLILVRLKNDQSVGQYRHSSTFGNFLQTLKQGDALDNSITKLESLFLTCLKALHGTRRQKVIEELVQQLEIEMTRSTSSLQTQNLKNLKGDLLK